MQLVDHWIVSFSSKSHLNNREGVRCVLRDILQNLRTLVESELVAMSSAAVGATSYSSKK
jgi:hypothetical protein